MKAFTIIFGVLVFFGLADSQEVSDPDSELSGKVGDIENDSWMVFVDGVTIPSTSSMVWEYDTKCSSADCNSSEPNASTGSNRRPEPNPSSEPTPGAEPNPGQGLNPGPGLNQDPAATPAPGQYPTSNCELDGSCAGKEDNSLPSYAENCSNFISCGEGCGFNTNCSENLHFNASANPTQGPNPGSGQNPGPGPNPDSGLKPEPALTPAPEEYPTGKPHTDSSLQATTPSVPTDPSTGHSGTVCESVGDSCVGLNNNALIPFNGNCAKYIQCFQGCGFVRDCGPGTHFNRKLSICDWPRNAGCVV